MRIAGIYIEHGAARPPRRRPPPGRRGRPMVVLTPRRRRLYEFNISECRRRRIGPTARSSKGENPLQGKQKVSGRGRRVRQERPRRPIEKGDETPQNSRTRTEYIPNQIRAREALRLIFDLA
ncbi:hypothetical protein EVAR_63076_1 [Eumeta japonica]|uniref:Uncharacterized protein n=1 Tax=Eumeta variegata TaxID=151549 RepID=A0A4C1ZUE5_EUMVA|nr:hypothetical protein EVAR_63076_1 [Eumeta japonica]